MSNHICIVMARFRRAIHVFFAPAAEKSWMPRRRGA